MSPLRPIGWTLLAATCITCSFAFLSAGTGSSDDDDDSDKRYETRVETPLIGDYTNFAGLSPIMLEGVGLVVGLNGTGGDPAPSFYRTSLMEDLKRRGVPNPNAILQSPNTALVLVRAYLPPLMKKGEKIDLEVRLPDSAEASSLAGGWLMETYLTEQAFVPGRSTPLLGHAYAKAGGAILTAGIGSDASNSPELLKRGRILGGATVLKERELALYLRHDFRSIRNATRLSEVIGKRFHHFDEYGIKKPMAKAKTDQKIVLNVHPRYKDNYPRYLQVIRHMAFRETPVGARVRMQRLQKEIFLPERAEGTCLELEAIGNDAIPILKEGLTSSILECRMHAACALAYLGNIEGLSVLEEAARTERAFRVFALAAIATLEDADAHITLRKLMDESNPETRYGAFRALWTLDKRDPFIRGEVVGIPEEEKEDRKGRKAGEWSLHVLETSGEPLAHALTRTRPEIVIFGAEQQFRTPMYVTAGRHIIVTSQPGASSVTLSKFEVGKPDQTRETSLNVADVIRAADELGATYPDVVQMLFDASRQKNLSTKLAIDALPESGRIYYRPDATAEGPNKTKKVKFGRDHMSPNMFPEQSEPDPEAGRKKAEARANMANIPQESKSENGKPAERVKPKMTADDEPPESSTRSRKKTSDDEKKSEDKPKGKFSWLGNWTRSDK